MSYEQTFRGAQSGTDGVKIIYNPVTASDLERALDALIMEDIPPMLEPTDITVMSLAARAKCSPMIAKRVLAGWVEMGKAEYLGKRREARGHKVDAWRLQV